MTDYIKVSESELNHLAEQDLTGLGYTDCGLSIFRSPTGKIWPELDEFALQNMFDEIWGLSNG